MNVYLFYVSNNRLWRYFPNSVLALANPIIKAGFNPIIVDTALQDWRAVPIVDPLFIGFSAYTDANISVAVTIAKEMRGSYPQLKLAWGGPHVIMLPEQTIKHHLVDFACFGEGETAVSALAKAIAAKAEDFHNVPGVYWKNSRGEIVKNPPAAYVNLDEEELYPYRLLDERLYPLKNGKMYYEASRGCPFGCKFCSYDHEKWRTRSPLKVVDDLAAIEAEFSPQEIQIIDANHFINLSWARQIWSEKIKRGLKLKWETNCRFDILAKMPDEMLSLIRDSGCYQLRFGAESGSQEILDYLNKGITVEQILAGVERCQRAGINPVLSFMMGYPLEDDARLGLTMELIDKLWERFPGIQINGLFQFQPYPNTVIFKEISEKFPIPQPRDLEGWGDYQIIEFHRTDFPWLEKKKYRSYVVLNSIVSYIFFADRLLSIPYAQRKNIFLFRFGLVLWLFKIADYIIRRIFVRPRWKKRFMLFPFEWYAWNFIRKHILKIF